MKRILFSAMLMATMASYAQDTYINYTLTQGSDLFGTARYVGMGGALGALGADISAISLNPAGIGLYKRNDISLTAGCIRQVDDKGLLPNATLYGSFDQIGTVFALGMGNEDMTYLNFAFNYQKKADFHHTFFADQPYAGGLSLSCQMANMAAKYADDDYMPSALSQAMYDAGVIYKDEQGFVWQPTNTEGAFIGNLFQSDSEGAVHAFDFNVSGNYEDRYYWGVTLGVDYLKYINRTYYTERCGDEIQPYDFEANAWKKVAGVGVNVKFGFIGRPIEDSPLRIGLALETPTFYSLKMDANLDVISHTNAQNPEEWNAERQSYPQDCYMNYNLNSPWRLRASVGYTVGKWLAIGTDYEYAMYNRTKVSYDDYTQYWDDSWSSSEKDLQLNDFTAQTLRGVHGFRIGGEAKVSKWFALRTGYNYYSTAFKRDAFLAHDASMSTMDVATTAHYMNLSDVNIFTFGMGWKGTHAYFDIAYKYRMQSGQFYAFDDIDLMPVHVNLNRHQMLFSLGYKF